MNTRHKRQSKFSMKDDPLKAAWENVVLRNSQSDASVRPEILNSWIKSKKMGLDPFSNEPPTKISGEKLQKLFSDNKSLIKIAKPVMEMIEILIRDTGFILTLSDKSGYVLISLGDNHILDMAKRNFYIPGCRRDMENAGTNAIGLCLELVRPIQLTGCEHYRVKHHDWTCSSAPIFDHNNHAIGAITLSGHCTGRHQHTLGLVTSAAESISTQLRERSLNNKIKLLHCLLSSILNSMGEAVIAVDNDLKITHLNQHAYKLFNMVENEVLGRPIEKAFLPDESLMIALNTNSFVKGLEVGFSSLKNNSSFMCRIDPIRNPGNTKVGKLIILTEKEDVLDIVKKVGGNYAKYEFSDIKGENESLKRQIGLAKIAAKSDSRILIFGESGTGKELFAQSIHMHSRRSKGPFVAISCAAIPRDLVESELFGYRAGAFTGARKEGMMGKIELANRGTFFLDEINALPLDIQAKFLRVLQQEEVMRLGCTRTTRVDIRVIAATNTDLFEEVETKHFREDLYYRLNVVEISIPPLRERLDDLEILIGHFLKRQCIDAGFEIPRFSQDAMEVLKNYHWPGNIRELENCIERAVVLSQCDEMCTEHLPDRLLKKPDNSFYRNGKSLNDGLREMIISALDRCDGNVSKTARELNIARSTLYRKMDDFGISNSG